MNKRRYAGKVRIDMRLEPDLYAGLVKLAKANKMSINHLLNAIGRVAVKKQFRFMETVADDPA